MVVGNRRLLARNIINDPELEISSSEFPIEFMIKDITAALFGLSISYANMLM